MQHKFLLWLLIVAMLVKTSVLPCAAMSEINMLPSVVSTHQVDLHAQHQPVTKSPQHCAVMAMASSEPPSVSAPMLASDVTDSLDLTQHDCHSCQSCGAASSMIVASIALQTQLYPDIVPQFTLTAPPLVWLALPLRPPKLV